MWKPLVEAVQAAGKKLVSFPLAGGVKLEFLPFGARVLGLFAADSDENFYWTNPALRQVETARALFAREGWQNTGGDRTWIAPELDTFFTDANLDKYWQPRQLDMSEYRLECDRGGLQLSQEMKLHLARSNSEVSLRLTKWFGPAANPLRYDSDRAAIAGVQYAGYTQRVAMQSLDKVSSSSSLVAIWNLIQLPEGGEMIAPIYSRTVPQPCFGNVPPDHVTVEDHVVRMNMELRGSHKLALKATATCGRVGYAYRQGDAYALVIRNFPVNPSGKYIDVQRQDMQDFGYAVQLCRVDEAEFGSFCELEYHVPAWGDLPDPARSEDVSQVWAFRGDRTAIDAVARKLLGAKSLLQ
jgi:hypothetical protein